MENNGILTEKRMKILKTCNLYLCFIVLGMSVAIPGPTLLDLQNLVNTDTQHIAFIYTARSTGYLAGSFAGGILFDALAKEQFLLTFFNFIASATILAIPWSRSIRDLTISMVANGITLGVLDTGGNVCCLNIWGKDSGPYYQALHFSFGVGGLIAPLIAAPFLSEYNVDTLDSGSENTTLVNYTNSKNISGNLSIDSSETSSEFPNVSYAYFIIGGISLVVAVLFLVTWIIAPTDPTANKQDKSQATKNSPLFIFILVLLTITLMFVEAGTEIGYSQMLSAYVVKGQLKLSATTGSYMTSAFWAAFTISRFGSVFLAIKFSDFTLIVFDIIVTSIGALILLFLGTVAEWAMWLATILIGVGIASFFPAAVGWIEKYITVTNKIASSVTVGAAFGEMLIPYVISYYIDSIPEVLIYVVVASCVCSGIVIVTMYCFLKNKPLKYQNQKGISNPAFDAHVNNSPESKF